MKMKNRVQDFAKYVSLNVMGMIGLSCYILADTFLCQKVWERTASQLSIWPFPFTALFTGED